MTLLRAFMLIAILSLVLPASQILAVQTPEPGCVVTTNDNGDAGLPEDIIPGTMMIDSDRGPAGTKVYPEDNEIFGIDGIWIFLPIDGIYHPELPDWVLADGSVLWAKIMIYRDDPARGEVAITGQLQNDPTVVLESIVMDGFGSSGLQIAGVTFPDIGCWDVTITSGAATMEFTMQVVREMRISATPEALR